jgi:hypothetical protein
MANNRELSQLASFVTVDDTSKTISFASTIASLNVTGVGTFGSLAVGGVTVSAATVLNPTLSSLVVSGISTLGVTSTTNLTSQQLNVSGISTLGVTSTTNLTSQQLNVSGISTLGTGVTALPIKGLNIGIGSLSNSYVTGSGIYNVQIGHEQAAISGNQNVAIGASAGRVITGSDNVFIGRSAGVVNAAGAANIGIGFEVLTSNTTGNDNIVLGYQSGDNVSTGSSNVLIGRLSGFGITTGGNNIAIGQSAGTDAVLNFSESVAMGATSNIIVIGNNAHTKSYIKIDWTITSDERDKNILGEVPHGLEFIQSLEPIKFQFKNRESGEVSDDTLRYGFRAQQVVELEGNPHVIADVQDPENLKVTSSQLIPVLVNAIKELSAKVAELEARLDAP